MPGARLVGVAVCVAVLGSGASASASRMMRLYEPDQPELVVPAPLTLEDPTHQRGEAEGGFVFQVGTVHDKIGLAQCAGGFAGQLMLNNANRDQIRLESGYVGVSGECPGQFGTADIELGGFPLVLTLVSNGKGKVAGDLEIHVKDGAGLPPDCLYRGKVLVSGKIATVGQLTLNMRAELRSPVHECLRLFLTTDPEESGYLSGLGANEALYVSLF